MTSFDLFEDPVLPPEAAKRYRLVESLGVGGMGEVFRARDLRMKRDVALKVIRAIHGENRKALQRFRREVRTLARIDHPAVVRIFDFHEEDGLDFYTMELVEGRSLADRLLEGPLSVAELDRVGPILFEGLAAAHEAGIIHRDLKPANVVIRRDGAPLILDFGLAKIVDRETVTALTRTGEMLGTLRYLPPEMVVAGRMGAPGDVFQLGLTLWEAATGATPHEGENSNTIVPRLARPDFAPPSHLRPGLPERFDEVLLAALAPEEADRPSAADMARLLSDPAGATLRRIESARSGRRRAVADTAPLSPLGISPPKRSSLKVLLACTGLMVLLAMAALQLRRPSTPPPSPPPPETPLHLAETRLVDLDRLHLRLRGPATGRVILHFEGRGSATVPPMPSRHVLELSELGSISRTVRGRDVPLVPPLLRPARLVLRDEADAELATAELDPHPLLHAMLSPLDRLDGERLLRLTHGVDEIRKLLDQARGRSDYPRLFAAEGEKLKRLLAEHGLDEERCARLRRFLPALLGDWTATNSPLGLRLLPLRRIETSLCNREGLDSPWGWSCELMGIRFDGVGEFPVVPGYREIARRSFLTRTATGRKRWLWLAEPVFLERQRASFTAAIFNFRKIVPEMLRMKGMEDPDESLPSTVEEVATRHETTLEVPLDASPWPPDRVVLDLGLRLFDRPYQITARLNDGTPFVIMNTCQIPRTDPSLVRSTLRLLVVGHPVVAGELRRGPNRLVLEGQVIPGKEALHPISLWGARLLVRP